MNIQNMQMQHTAQKGCSEHINSKDRAFHHPLSELLIFVEFHLVSDSFKYDVLYIDFISIVLTDIRDSWGN